MSTMDKIERMRKLVPTAFGTPYSVHSAIYEAVDQCIAIMLEPESVRRNNMKVFLTKKSITDHRRGIYTLVDVSGLEKWDEVYAVERHLRDGKLFMVTNHRQYTFAQVTKAMKKIASEMPERFVFKAAFANNAWCVFFNGLVCRQDFSSRVAAQTYLTALEKGVHNVEYRRSC